MSAFAIQLCLFMIHQLETRTLSDEGKRQKDGANPYPLYSAIERTLFHKKEAKGEKRFVLCELSKALAL